MPPPISQKNQSDKYFSLKVNECAQLSAQKSGGEGSEFGSGQKKPHHGKTHKVSKALTQPDLNVLYAQKAALEAKRQNTQGEEGHSLI